MGLTGVKLFFSKRKTKSRMLEGVRTGERGKFKYLLSKPEHMTDCMYLRVQDYLPEVVPGKDEIWQCLNPEAQKARGLESYFSEEYKELFEGRLDYTGACNNCPYKVSHEGKVIIDVGSTRTVLPQELVKSTLPENVLGFSNAVRDRGHARSRSLPPSHKQLNPPDT